jgi:DNA-binding transcriptional MocR family regulator
VEPAAVLLCVGAQQAIHLAFADLRRQSRSIASEGATFSGAISAAADLGLDWRPVDHDEEGMVPDDLDRVLADTGCRIIYATPVCQNPLGLEAGEARRREIVRVCERHDAYIVEDDIYGLYAAKGRVTYKQLAPDRVYYLTSLSKCLTPLARVGVLVPPEDRQAQITRALRAQVFGAAPVALELGCALIELGADRVAADALREEAKLRTGLAAEILALRSVPMPEGCPHLWLPMPALAAEKLARRASEHGVRLTPPDATSIGGETSAGIRLCILAPPRREDLEHALRTIVGLLEDQEETVV